MSAWVDTLVAFIGAHPHWAGLLVFAVSAAEAVLIVGIIVPGTAILIAIGGVVGLGHLPLLPILAWSALGAIAGDGFSYWMGHRYQDSLRQRWPFSRYPDLIGRGEAFFHRHGGKSVLFGRFVPPLKPVVPLVAGILGMPPGRFYAVNVASALLWSPAHILPGVLIGASLGLLHGISPRLMGAVLALLLAAAALAWTVRVAVVRLGPTLVERYRRGYRWARSRPGGWGGRVLGWLDPDHPATPALVVALGVLLGAIVGFIGILQDVLAGDPLVLADHAISHLMNGLRNPWTDPVMVVITSLGDPAVALPVALAVLAVLLITGARRLAGGVALALGLTGAAVWVLKALVHLPRPQPMYSGVEALAFPSGHAAMATVLYGLVAWLVTTGRGTWTRVATYLCAFAWVFAIGLSRVYLGAHWPSDVLAGVLLGTVAVATTALVYGGVPHQRLRAGVLAAVTLAVLALAGSWHVASSYPARAAQYLTRPAPIPMASVDWLAGAWRELPARRIDLAGGNEEPIALQWAGSPQSLA